jgi:hypothetical protein
MVGSSPWKEKDIEEREIEKKNEQQSSAFTAQLTICNYFVIANVSPYATFVFQRE